MINKTFDNPTQIRTLIIDEMNEETGVTNFKICGAIAYKDFIICGCCGQVFKYDDPNVYLVEEYKEWISITEAITGEC